MTTFDHQIHPPTAPRNSLPTSGSLARSLGVWFALFRISVLAPTVLIKDSMNQQHFKQHTNVINA